MSESSYEAKRERVIATRRIVTQLMHCCTTNLEVAPRSAAAIHLSASHVHQSATQKRLFFGTHGLRPGKTGSHSRSHTSFQTKLTSPTGAMTCVCSNKGLQSRAQTSYGTYRKNYPAQSRPWIPQPGKWRRGGGENSSGSLRIQITNVKIHLLDTRERHRQQALNHIVSIPLPRIWDMHWALNYLDG